MTMDVHIDTDADYGGHEALIDALALMTRPADVHGVISGLHRSVMYRCNVLKPGNPRHIAGGTSIPYFYRRAFALCEARLEELRAEGRQASWGASPGTGREGKTDANGRDGSASDRQRDGGHDQAPGGMGNQGSEAVPCGALPDERWLMG